MSRETFAALLVVAAVSACGPPSTVAQVRDTAPAATTTLPAAGAVAAARPARVAAVELLRRWDERRAAAWARGDPRLLRPLYTAGSVAGRRDRSMLRSWVARGLVVRGLRTQLLAVRTLEHRRTTWTLEVTDRVLGGVAVGPGVRRPLPRDRPSTRVVRLRRVDGAWRVASVGPGGGAVSGGF
jgi:hypothetical protein